MAGHAGVSRPASRNGMKIVAVNGRRFSVDAAQSRDCRTRRTRDAPMEFIVDNGSYFKTVRIDSPRRVRYPHLQRTGTGEDVLRAIAAPKVK